MNRKTYERQLDGWLEDVRTEALRQFDRGIPAPLCLAFAEHDVYKAWCRGSVASLQELIPPTLFPIN